MDSCLEFQELFNFLSFISYAIQECGHHHTSRSTHKKAKKNKKHRKRSRSLSVSLFTLVESRSPDNHQFQIHLPRQTMS